MVNRGRLTPRLTMPIYQFTKLWDLKNTLNLSFPLNLIQSNHLGSKIHKYYPFEMKFATVNR